MVTGTTSSSVVQPTSLGNGSITTSNSVEAPTRRLNENRRSNKPIMEKRRRARINNCLNELKTLILDAMKKDPARHSKLEKADILEMTVKHLQNLQRQQVAMSAATDPAVIGKFRAGFSECASEVGRYPGLDPTAKRRLLQHLANCLNQGKQEPQVQVHILPNPAGVEPAHQPNPPASVASPSNSIILSNGNGTSLHLVPTRLPNGDIALVLPTNPSAPNNSPLPLLVPIPTRTASNASASSSSSSCSSANGSEPMEVQSVRYSTPPMQKPLSLVVKKCQEPAEDERPWRPW